jgi:hypothetical protein
LYKQMKALDESMVALERARKAADAQPDASRTRDCLRCGVTFEPARANHRFCTEKCRKDAFRTRKPAA